ncbi:hypothetical protein FOVSG1_006654 [Fusarium oxysporum f. sp. vasinfectum]
MTSKRIHRVLTNTNGGLQASIEAWKLAPRNSDVAFRLIHTANKVGDYSRTVRLVQYLTDEKHEWGAFVLAEILSSFRYAGDFISFACNETQQLSVARDAFAAAVTQAKSDDNSTRALAKNALGMLYYQYYKDKDKAVDVWETIPRDFPNTEGAVEASLALAPLYFDQAINPGTSQDSRHLFNLTRRTTKISSQPDSHWTWTSAAAHISALMGRCYRLHNELDKARQAILPLVNLALDDLTDTDADNDYWAYEYLGQALLCMGDRQNAQIAYAFTKPLRKFG